MKRYAIFFDIDGTIIPEVQGPVPESAREAIRIAREKGHYTFINTGRTYPCVDQFIQDLQFDGYVCGCGTNIYFHGEELLSKELTNEKCKQMVKDLFACKIDGVLEGKHNVYYRKECLHPQVNKIKNSRNFFGKQGCFQKDWDDETILFDKMALWMVEGTDFETFHEKYKDEFEFIKRDVDFYELVPLGYSKASGIQFIEEHLGISHDHTIAIGDSMNDMSMLEYAGISIAMGNSHPYLLDKVTYVTATLEEDGIYKALEHYGII